MPASSIDLNRLRPGAHLCRFYEDDDDLAVGAATFVANGLAAGLRVVYLAGARDPLRVQESLAENGIGADCGLATGQLIIRSGEEVCGDEPPDLIELAATFRSLNDQAHSDGMTGLRIAAEMGDAIELFGSLEELLRWEATATRLQQETGISTVCQYDRRSLAAAQTRLLAAQHSGTSPATSPPPMAKFHLQRDALRVVGELDLSNSQRLHEVIAARLRVRPRLMLDLADLTFMDAGTMSMLFRLPSERPDIELVLRHTSPQLRRYLRLAGLWHPRVMVS